MFFSFEIYQESTFSLKNAGIFNGIKRVLLFCSEHNIELNVILVLNDP